MLMSGRCVPPAACGSLATNRSPSAISVNGTLARMAAIMPIIEARWIGSECSACTISRPSGSQIAVEWSRRSLMLVEYALRISAMKVSSVTERSALNRISIVTASSAPGLVTVFMPPAPQ